MIRLNDINKTVIDENLIIGYGKNDDSTGINLVLSYRAVFVEYNSYETRDKDIELLDKLFDVKSIEDKANAYPHEIDALKFAMSGIKKECEPVKEEYITWDYVKQFECGVNAYLSEGSICKAYYEEDNDRIQLGLGSGYIYDKDLFNALKLRKVE